MMAKKRLIDLEFELDPKSVKTLQEQSAKNIEEATVGTVTRLLERVEDATLITQYTQTPRPSKPTGSTYIRKFRLQRSSQKRIIRDKLPVEGAWEAKTEYASFVIGLAQDQAPIHRGRWPSLELAINNVNTNISRNKK